MKKRGLIEGSRAQVWVETVVYTLIGLTIIGVIIGVSTPKIKQMTDKAIIEQTISVMNEIDKKVHETQQATGNSRIVDIQIKKGKIIIDSPNNTIYFVLEGTSLKYSKPGSEIAQGDIILLTEENNKKYDVNLILKYGFDIIFNGAQETKTFTQAPTPYRVLIENKGGGVLDIHTV